MTTLLMSTGSSEVDSVLQNFVITLEKAFPNRIRGYFIEGSYADQTAIYTSDVDLFVLFKNRFQGKSEHDKARQLISFLESASTIELDVSLLSENELAEGAPPALLLGSVLLFGEPLPDDMSVVPIDTWTRERMHAAYWLLNKVLGRPDIVVSPLGYPNPEREFYGYTERIVQLKDGSEVASTRDLIRVMGWAATALVALLAGQIVVRKQDLHRTYKRFINDEWTHFLETLQAVCRNEWLYQIPSGAADRARLRAICLRALAFENHFLNLYRDFLLTELGGRSQKDQLRALRLQAELPFAHANVLQLVRRLTTANDDHVKQSALRVWQRHQEARL